ncbi:MAG: sulfotransferase family protein [Acidobacteriota bacterium]
MNDLTGWVPIDVYRSAIAPQLMVDWCYLGAERFTDSFFQQTIEWRLQHPFHLLFRHQTPIDALSEWRAQQPGLQAAGFIFHMSRCGSTLISQMLAALPQNVVLSEPMPIDRLLRAPGTDEQRLIWLQGLVSALGQPRQGGERHLFIKFDSWSVADLPLISRAFPATPWLFVYRNPVEVLMSHAREPGSQTIPGVLDPRWLGLDLASAGRMPLMEYTARVLARICQSALEHRHIGRGRFINYSQLPSAVWSQLPAFVGMEWSHEDQETLRRSTQQHAKDPARTFIADAEAKRQAAPAGVRELAERFLQPLYVELEAARQAQEETA